MQSVTYFAGRSPDAAQHSVAAIADADTFANPHQLAFAHLGRLTVAVSEQDVPLARTAYADAIAWADIAMNRLVGDLAPMYLSIALGDGEPTEVLRIAVDLLQSHFRSGFWGTVDVALRRVLVPLATLERYGATATVLGGLTVIAQANPDTFNMRGRATTLARDALGDQFETDFARGQTLTITKLVRYAIDEANAALT